MLIQAEVVAEYLALYDHRLQPYCVYCADVHS